MITSFRGTPESLAAGEGFVRHDAIEISGGFVGKTKCRTITSALPERRAAGSPPDNSLGRCRLLGRKTHAMERFANARLGGRRDYFGKAQRQLDIFLERHAGRRLERLENIPTVSRR